MLFHGARKALAEEVNQAGLGSRAILGKDGGNSVIKSGLSTGPNQ